LRKKLVSEGHALVPVEKNLVDAVWEDRPSRPVNAVMVQPLQWTGLEILFFSTLSSPAQHGFETTIVRVTSELISQMM